MTGWGLDEYILDGLYRDDLMRLGYKLDTGEYNFPRGVPDPVFEQWLKDDYAKECECYKRDKVNYEEN